MWKWEELEKMEWEFVFDPSIFYACLSVKILKIFFKMSSSNSMTLWIKWDGGSEWEAYISDATQFISSLDFQTAFYVWLASVALAILPSSMMFPEPWQGETVIGYTVVPFRSFLFKTANYPTLYLIMWYRSTFMLLLVFASKITLWQIFLSVLDFAQEE